MIPVKQLVINKKFLIVPYQLLSFASMHVKNLHKQSNFILLPITVGSSPSLNPAPDPGGSSDEDDDLSTSTDWYDSNNQLVVSKRQESLNFALNKALFDRDVEAVVYSLSGLNKWTLELRLWYLRQKVNLMSL